MSKELHLGCFLTLTDPNEIVSLSIHTMDCLITYPLTKPFQRHGRVMCLWLVLTCAQWAAIAKINAQAADALSTRSMIEQWIQAEKAVNKAKSDWRLDRQNLIIHKRLLDSEKKSLDEQLNGLDKNQISVSEKRKGLNTSIASLASTQAILENRLKESEAKLETLLPKLPPLLRKKIEARMPAPNTNPTTTSQQASKLVRRLQKLIGIWTEIHQFQNEVTVVKQVIPLVDTSEVEAEVLYLGLAQAFFVTPDNQRSGIGKSEASGWVWTEIPKLGPEVRNTLNALNLPDPRSPVTLPTTLNKEE